MAKISKGLGSSAWVKEFTATCNEFGYPSLTEREVLGIYANRQAGVFNDLDPIAVLMNNAFLREETKDEPVDEDEVSAEVEAPAPTPAVVPASVKKLKPVALAARQLLMDKYKAKVKP